MGKLSLNGSAIQVNAMVLIPYMGKTETKAETTKLKANCLGVKPCFSSALNLSHILISLDFIYSN